MFEICDLLPQLFPSCHDVLCLMLAKNHLDSGLLPAQHEAPAGGALSNMYSTLEYTVPS